MWEFTTGGGYQQFFKKGFLGYVELGIPFYVGGGRLYRSYDSGIPKNRYSNGDIILFSFRSGFGFGYRFELD
jgi:hypothetical protein